MLSLYIIVYTYYIIHVIWYYHKSNDVASYSSLNKLHIFHINRGIHYIRLIASINHAKDIKICSCTAY